MIFLSAQPDQYYFLWQLKLQLFNFKNLGIKLEQIHVLVGYDINKGVSNNFKHFKEQNPKVKICFYEDTRASRLYLPSLRPHIISKHFKAFPELTKEAIFYHDSDIVFSSLPNFDPLLTTKTWYTSDTRSYLNTNYIRSLGGDFLFVKMCSIVGVSPEIVVKNDFNAGGAQYLIKNCNVRFWEKIESDCEKLFYYLSIYRRKNGFCNNVTSVDPWITDMWVFWWNALLFNEEFRIHEELSFSWVNSNIKEWETKKILHYTGLVKQGDKTLFKKKRYSNCAPFFDDFSEINKDTCSFALVKLINKYNYCSDQKRIDLSDVSFLIPVKVDSEDRIENIYGITTYLSHHFKTTIYLLEIDKYPKLKKNLFHEDVSYSYIKDGQAKLHRTKYHNHLINISKTPYVSLHDSDVIIPICQIMETVRLLRSNRFQSVSPYDGRFYSVDILMKSMFIKLMDDNFLSVNENKMSIGTRRSYGGCIFFNRELYRSVGAENENINFWGPDDIERVKRLKILGYETKRVRGPLYHLYHRRSTNSGYQSMDEMMVLMEEYLKVANSSKVQLEEYIKTWNWL